MKARASYTISEVVQLSGKSVSTVTRLVESDNPLLEPVPDSSSPVRLTAESVHDYLRSLLEKAPQLPDGVPRRRDPDGDDPKTALRNRIEELEQRVAAKASRIEELEGDNARLRNTILVLRQNYAALSDDMGAYTSPRFPNN